MSTLKNYPLHWPEEADFFRDLLPDLVRTGNKLVAPEKGNTKPHGRSPSIIEKMVEGHRIAVE